jgi:leucine-rich repeat protein SHOC2
MMHVLFSCCNSAAAGNVFLRIFIHYAQIPDVFESLPNLERLDVSCNNLRALPNSIGHLSMLKCLITHSNALVGIPHTCCGMTHLEIADFSVNMIETLPNELSEMACLTALNISRNKIDNLPLDVGNLCNLEILDASCNMLSTLPASMLSLNKLAVGRNPPISLLGNVY